MKIIDNDFYDKEYPNKIMMSALKDTKIIVSDKIVYEWQTLCPKSFLSELLLIERIVFTMVDLLETE